MEKTKKKILGMLVVMVMSLGAIGGINTKENDSNLMGCAYAYWSMAQNSKSAGEAAFNYGISAFSAGYGTSLGVAGAVVASNPVGWVVGGIIIGA